MRSRLLLIAFLVAMLGIAIPAAGQITITVADASAMLAAGKTSWTYQDTATTSLNIGALGSTSWDFRSLHINFAAALASVDPASTPYSADFPGATNVFQTTQTVQGVVATVYQYFTLSTNLLNPGMMGGGTYSGFPLVYSIKNTPAALNYALPSTINSTWSTSYAERTLITAGTPPFVLTLQDTTVNYAESYKVDAYGELMLPGGAAYQALRIRFEERSPTLSVGYIFIAKEGVIVTVKATDTLSLSTGVIPVSGVSWISPTAVAVPNVRTAPSEYALYQNFPNPFNPTTQIRYVVAGAGTQTPGAIGVRLAVYDLLGREVAVLVNEPKAPGEYTAVFRAEGLSSGVYLYRLVIGNFVQTRRMLLVR